MSVDMDIPILVVDDYKTMRSIVRSLLSQLGFNNVLEASDGVRALEILKSQPISLILSDWNMQPMNGYEFLCEVRKVNKKIPVVMVTAENTQENFKKALEAGVTNYILKPFTGDTLKKKLTIVLGPF